MAALVALVALGAMLLGHLPYGPRLGALEAETSEERAWLELAAPEIDPAALAARLPELVRQLEEGHDITAAPPFLFIERDEASRAARAAALEQRYEAARQRLKEAGYELDSASEGFTLVWVRHAGSHAQLVASADGRILLAREPNVAAAPPAPPEPRARREGGLPQREALAHVLDVWLWTQTADDVARAHAGPGSVSGRVARLALDGAKLPDGLPPLLRDGLVCWLQESVDPRAKEAPLHLCGGKPPAVLAQLDGSAPPTTVGARLVGKALLKVLEGRKDLPDALARYVAAAGTADARWAAAFGAPAKDAFAAVQAGGKGAAEVRTRCGANGRLPCPACAGGGRLELACDACAGLGGVACAACGGSASCRAPMCLQGWHPSSPGKVRRCAACEGYGSFVCLHCKMKPRQACKLCNASGRRALPCPLCRGEKSLPCPEAGAAGVGEGGGASPATCVWCADAKVTAACGTCFATGFAGCDTCHGSGGTPCPFCDGLGCARCGDYGYNPCGTCGGQRAACSACKGKGQQDLAPAACAACGGTQRGPSPEVARRLRAAIGLPLSEAERADLQAAVERAIAFLVSCRSGAGDFRLREFRRDANQPAGILFDASEFSNAIVLWTLTLAGVPPQDPRVAPAWGILRKAAQSLTDGPDAELRIQAASLTLRCLLAGRQDADREVTARLAKRLVDAQLPGGLWGEDATPKAEPGELESLMALEALLIAQGQGVKVPPPVWERAFSGATKSTGMLRKTKRKSAFTTGSDVASVGALLIIARAGRDPQAPQSRESLLAIPGVAKSLDWLERYAELSGEPVVADGVRHRRDTDASTSAWLYAVQRLGQLLALDRLGSRAWYAEGTRELLARQLPDGSFEELGPQRLNGPVRATCAALLFLLRATPSVTAAAGK